MHYFTIDFLSIFYNSIRCNVHIKEANKKWDRHQRDKSRVALLMNKLIYYIRVTKNKNRLLLSHANSRFVFYHNIIIKLNINVIVFSKKKESKQKLI